ncbi:Kae1-associated serine/threonine protein kinase [Candidatus Woesearchaeota archaeon]|nr:Kae1-associated serine/threonine protein kinase [Candidatus Woesearchaeota archaeon]
MKKIAQGAEAVIFIDRGAVLKERVPKAYRLKEIDEALRKKRTKKEAKVIEDAGKLIPVPGLVNLDISKKSIWMDLIKGEKIRDILEKSEYRKLCRQIGIQIAKLHDADIIHGDLTTSNFMLGDDKKIYFIDFGLSFTSAKIEDKAVDLHLLREAFESKHYTIWEACLNSVLEGYKETSKDAEAVISRYESVEKRGRNKTKW